MNAQATLVGNVTRDPEINYSNTGTAYTKFSLAVNKFKKGKNGAEDESVAHFFDITCFNTLAENTADSISQGDRLIVVGELNQDHWEDESGARSKITMIANHVGPELSYATAEIQKTDKQPAKKSGSSKSSGAPRRNAGGNGNSRRYNKDEEEF